MKSLIEFQKANKKTFIKKRLETLYDTMIKNSNIAEMPALSHQNSQFKQFTISHGNPQNV